MDKEFISLPLTSFASDRKRKSDKLSSLNNNNFENKWCNIKFNTIVFNTIYENYKFKFYSIPNIVMS